MSWLDRIPTSREAYAYQASLLCADCGLVAINDLLAEGASDQGDSGHFPQGPYDHGGGEADSPQFCDRGPSCISAVPIAHPASDMVAKIGCPIENPLTSDGVLVLRTSILEDLVAASPHKRLVGRLLRRVWKDYSAPSETLTPWHRGYTMPPSLWRALKDQGLYKWDSQITPVALDTDNVYLTSRRGDVVHLLRAPVDDYGDFQSLDEVVVPASSLEGYDPYKAIAQAVSDGAWD